MSVTPRGMSIQEAYRSYRDGSFRVNRRYQRKLVWTIDEKRALIDSILQGYPVPLILLGYETDEEGIKRFEILDGMQRLNAVFSFIENRFALKTRRFDVGQLARAKQVADQGVFVAETDQRFLLPPDECANLLDYTLAVTEFPLTNEEAVNEVFNRINSLGRQLSPQERRQAGVVTPFANMVRELAAEFRGDVSRETLDLADMPSISIDVYVESRSDGINASDTFWCKQSVLRRKQLRDSEDEQMIADLAISVLEGRPFGFSGAKLDLYYKPGSAESKEINDRLLAYGVTTLKHHLKATLSILNSTLREVDPGPNALKKIVHPTAGSNPIKTAFYAVFFTFFELTVKQGKSPADPHAIFGALSQLQDRLKTAASQIRSAQRVGNIGVAMGLIQGHFEDSDPPVLDHGIGAELDFENALRRSRIEASAYECKQGLLRLGANRQVQDGLLDRIVCTCAAIANIGPGSTGALFIGVADDLKAKQRIEELDGIEAATIGSRFVVGVDREATLLGDSLDAYYRRIVSHIANSSLSEPLKSDILSRIDPIVYRSHSVICIWISPQTALSTVADTLYVRSGSSTVPVQGLSQITAVQRRFDRTGDPAVI